MKIAILILIFLPAVSVAQILSGTITDESGSSLPGCNVYLENTFFGATTNTEGHFEFEAPGIPAGKLMVEFIGYEDYVLELDLNVDHRNLVITLHEEFNTLNAVTVSAGQYGTGEGEKAVVLNSLDVVTTAGSLGDINAAMQTLPGTASNGESGRLYVHGGSSSETGTYIDGILVHEPYTSSTPNMAVRGRFNPFMFSGTSFSTGGYSAEYGQALSSVLVLNTRDIPEESSLNISLMTIGADLAGTERWENGALTFGANYTNLKPYMLIIPQNYEWDHEPEAYGAELSFRQKTKGKGLFKIYASADNTRMSQYQPLFGSDELQKVDLENRNRFVNANWKGMLNGKWILKTGGSFTMNTNAYGLEHSDLSENLNGAHLKALAIHEFRPTSHLKTGTEYFYREYSQRYGLKESTGDSTIGFSDHKLSAFSEFEHYFSNKLAFVAGLRLERGSYLNLLTLSPRLSMAYEIRPDQQLSMAWGIYHQDPENQWMMTSSSLTGEKAQHLILGYNAEFLERTLRVETYYKRYSDLITLGSVEGLSNKGTGYARGIDVYFRDRKTIKNGDYWVSYTFTDSKRKYLHYPVEARPAFTNAHTVSVVYKHWIPRWRSQVGATMRYGSPRPHNNPNSEEFMDEHLKPYRTLDLNWSFLYRENVIFHFAVSNVPGFKNSFGYTYSPQPDQNGIYARNEILPAADRFFFIGCFITLSPSGSQNQLEKIQ